MHIYNCTPDDLETIFEFYDMAIAYQKTQYHLAWQGFDRALVEQDIAEGRQWKIVADGRIACIFVTTFTDALIWLEREADPSVYIHRIATHNDFRGQKIMLAIIEWAKAYGVAHGKKYVRMDTWAYNQNLINYYVRCGFEHLGTLVLPSKAGLPDHYQASDSALLEMAII